MVREVRQAGLVASISGSTLWRWLHQDAIRPWYHRSWIFPRDPNFAEKAGRILDLYARTWEDEPLKDDEFVISADEKTSIQARRRKHPTRACRPRGTMKVEQVRSWIENYHKVKDHLERISEINRELLRRQREQQQKRKRGRKT